MHIKIKLTVDTSSMDRRVLTELYDGVQVVLCQIFCDRNGNGFYCWNWRFYSFNEKVFPFDFGQIIFSTYSAYHYYSDLGSVAIINSDDALQILTHLGWIDGFRRSQEKQFRF